MVMRAHYIAMDLAAESDKTYRQHLVEVWKDICPDRPANAQLLSDRARWIIRNEKLSRAELDNIKTSCYPQIPTEQPSTGVHVRTPRRSSARVRRSGLHTQVEDSNELEQLFLGNMMRFSGITPEKREKIPRMQHSKEFFATVKAIDSILPKYLEKVNTLQEIVDLVYAGAVTACEEHGRGTERQHDPRPHAVPPWKDRLEKKIIGIRKKVGVLHTYMTSENPSARVSKTVRKISSEFRLKRKDPSFMDKLAVVLDNLKQKIKAFGHRIRRYNERTKRHKNNKIFFQNQSQFFRDLEKTENEGDNRVDSKTAHKFWSDVWAGGAAHDDKAYWIEEARSQIPSIEMDELRISEADIKEALKGSNNWSAPGPDKLQNYWWKHLTSSHKTLSRLLQGTLEDPTTTPDFFTLGVTHLLPKDGDLQDPKNYRPITCLSAVYKILTSVLTRYISQYLRNNNLMAREQNGGRVRTKGSKELLVIDTILTKQARRKSRNISVAWVDYRKAFDSVPHSWLLEVLKMHGVNDKIIKLLKHLMKSWRTSLLM